MKRKIAAIMVGDFVGSTPAMEADEEGTVTRIGECLNVVNNVVSGHGGRVFDTAGDSTLSEFPSGVNALKAAVDARTALAELLGLPRKSMRFGLHLADLIEVGTGLKGDGINLASLIQSAADPGEIHVSGTLFDSVSRNSPCIFDNLGRRQFKGISELIQIYRVKTTSDRSRFQVAPTYIPEQTEKRPNSVAVTAFETASSADEDQLFLADGLTDDLTIELSGLRGVSVCSRSAASALNTKDPTEIGRILGLSFVLSGSVRKLGKTVRLNITLAETENGAIVWSDRIQRPFDDVINVLDEICARVVATVSGRVEHSAATAARRKQPAHMSAYEFFLRGIEQHRMGGITDEHVHAAISWFEKSIAADPNYSRPLAMHVCSASYLADFDIAKGEKMLEKALELDPTDPEANRIMGVVRIKSNRDFTSARYHHERALEFAPNDAYIMGRCAAFYVYVNEPEKALAMLEQADIFDPFLPVWVTEERVAAYYVLDRFEDALQTARMLPHQTRRTRIYSAASLVALGDLDAARIKISRALAEDSALTYAYIKSQELFEDGQILKLLIERACEAGLPR
jgi:adenylate cyclase